jgi:hypothetical protein
MTIQVIERHIVYALDHIFAPQVVYNWDDHIVSKLAAERPKARSKRRDLERKKEQIENGLEAFARTLGGGS